MLLEENRQLKEEKLCKVCLDGESNTVFLPCGHLSCCDVCSPALKNCPICRAYIRGTVRIFVSWLMLGQTEINRRYVFKRYAVSSDWLGFQQFTEVYRSKILIQCCIVRARNALELYNYLWSKQCRELQYMHFSIILLLVRVQICYCLYCKL